MSSKVITLHGAPPVRPRKGMKVSFYDEDGLSGLESKMQWGEDWEIAPGHEIRGHIVGTKGDIVFIELLEPVHFMDATDPIAFHEIKDWFFLPETNGLGYGLAMALEEAGRLPKGLWVRDDRIYLLVSYLPMEEIKKFCYELERGKRARICWYHGMIMTTVPVYASKGAFFELD